MNVPLLAAALLGCLFLPHGRGQTPEAGGTPMSLGFPGRVAAFRALDLTGDGRAELLLVGPAGGLFIYGNGTAGLEAEPRPGPILPEPARTLLALGDVLGEGGPQLVALSPAGIAVYRPGPRARFDSPPLALARGKLFDLRVNEPLFAEILRDVNQDGRLDLIVPGREHCELWLARPAAAGEEAPRIERAARVAVKTSHDWGMRAERISDTLYHAFVIPGLQIEDVNGDGRGDLLVETGQKRAFHLQRPDGALPERPDVELDLGLFRDTTPQGTLRLGRTLAGQDKPQLHMRDLDGDGLPDYVIAHRRKLWVFHGRPEGPRFAEPSAILRTAEDVTYLVPVRIDADPFPDLLLFRVQVPSLGTLLGAFLTDWDVEINLVAYRSRAGRTFEGEPAWRRDLTVRLPNLTGVLRNPERWLARFEEAGARFRQGLEADLDGDGSPDLALLSEKRERLDLWLKTSAAGPAALKDTVLRELLLGEQSALWDVERILAFLGRLAEQRQQLLTGGRAPDSALALRDPEDFPLLGLQTADIGGQGRSAIIAGYGLPRGAEGAWFDILEAPRRRAPEPPSGR